MTISYKKEVSSSSGFGCFLRILSKWRGSIYKIIWLDLLVFVGVYYSINLIHKFCLYGEVKTYFEKIVKHCHKYGNLIPLSFVLGFFVNIVVTRWWNQYLAIPSPDNLAIFVSAFIKSDVERARLVRRTIVRYVCVSFTITLSMISVKVKKRFPTLDHLVEAGLLLKDEKDLLENSEEEYPRYPKYLLPLTWAANLATRARREGLISEDVAVKSILDEIQNFRTKCSILLDYDWVNIPLVYTQVVSLAVYSYFLISLIGRQVVEQDEADMFIPLLPALEFFFYMGWLKVAEMLINPFGDDDDDFEVVWLIDRHLQVSYLIVDRIYNHHPALAKDFYWDKVVPLQLPHTLDSQPFSLEQPEFSTQNTEIKNTASPMIDGDSPDGTKTRHANSFITRLFRRHNPPPTVILSDVIANSDSTEEVSSSHLPTTVTDIFSTPKTKKEARNEGDPGEFNRLKEMRQSILKRKILLYYELYKKKTHKTDEEIITDLLMKKEE